MKHQRFLYFVTKIGIVSIIIVAMLFATVHKTDALTDDSETVQSEEVAAESDKAVISEKTESTESNADSKTPSASETPVSTDTDNTKKDSDTSEKTDSNNDTEKSDQHKESDQSSDSQTSENTDEPNEPDAPETPDTPESPEIPDDSEDIQDDILDDTTDNTDDTVDDIVNETTDDKSDSEQNTTIENTTENKSEEKTNSVQKKTSKKKQVNTSPNSEVSTSKKTKIKDESTDAVYTRSDFNPSEPFIALKDRIKYNESLPIDNIPSFITQEMIIGALKCQDETGYPASVTIAQIIQESGFGKYGPGGDSRQGLSYLAYEYCNLFGIKGTGTAGTVNMKTGEQASSGEYYSINAGFRVYNTYTECIEDRADLIKRVYSDLVGGITDANTFAMRIGSRWATSLQYSQHLIQQMERYDLYRLDRMTLKDFHDMIGEFSNPCPGSYVTSSFGYREFDHKFHKGIDLGTNKETIPVYAAESGTIIRAEYDNLAGNWVMIDHGNGLVTKYMHFSHTFVEEGQEVVKGQQIGLTGTTGRSTGIHLHFQVEENGIAVDPMSYLSDFE